MVLGSEIDGGYLGQRSSAGGLVPAGSSETGRENPGDSYGPQGERIPKQMPDVVTKLWQINVNHCKSILIWTPG